MRSVRKPKRHIARGPDQQLDRRLPLQTSSKDAKVLTQSASKKLPNNMFFILKDRMPKPSDDLLDAAREGKAVFVLAGGEVLRRKDGKPYFGGALRDVAKLQQGRGNKILYQDFTDSFDDYFSFGQNFPRIWSKHFSSAIVSNGLSIIGPHQSKAARYLDPSIKIDNKTSTERRSEMAEKTPLQRGVVCCRWQYPDHQQVLIVRRPQAEEDDAASKRDAQLNCGADTVYEVFDQEDVSLEEQTIYFLSCALGPDPSKEEKDVLFKLWDKFDRDKDKAA